MVYVLDLVHPIGASSMPPSLTGKQCVMKELMQHVPIYRMLFVVILVHRFANFGILNSVIAIYDCWQKTLTFVPMLKILFVSTGTRPLQLAKATDGMISPFRQ